MFWNDTVVKKYPLITITISICVKSNNLEICTENDFLNKKVDHQKQKNIYEKN